MPLYLYICDKCGMEFEEVLKIEDRNEPCGPCSECEGSYERVIGNSGGFRLKGDGWGEDGYDKYIGDINKTRRINGKPEVGYEDIHGKIEG